VIGGIVDLIIDYSQQFPPCFPRGRNVHNNKHYISF